MRERGRGGGSALGVLRGGGVATALPDAELGRCFSLCRRRFPPEVAWKGAGRESEAARGPLAGGSSSEEAEERAGQPRKEGA